MKRPPRGSYGEAPTALDSIGKRVRKVRLAWHWSQVQLAKAIHTNQKTLSRWELDQQKPGDPAMGALAAIFGLSVEVLRTGKGFCIPAPPRQVGDLLLSEAFASGLVRLPPVGEEGLLLVQRSDESAAPLTPRKAAAIIRKSREEGRPVWLVVG
jgi:transcriptional regulator with XRE-family HTH domain